MSERRYLPLLTAAGELIPAPEYMVLAALSHTDLPSIEETYHVMLRAEPQYLRNERLSETAQVVKSKIIDARVQGRVFAGEVVLALVRMRESTGGRPTLLQARKLVAWSHQALVNKKSSFNTVVREVEKRFKDYRDVSHLWAAFICRTELVPDVEGEESPIPELLGRAKWFEDFLDHHVFVQRSKWHPFRIPERFPPMRVALPPLTEDELRVLGIATRE